MRIVAPCVVHRRDRSAFVAMIEYACRTAGAAQNPLSDPAMELLFRASRGLRFAAKLLHAALRAADQRGQAFLDDAVMTTAVTDHRLDGRFWRVRSGYGVRPEAERRHVEDGVLERVLARLPSSEPT